MNMRHDSPWMGHSSITGQNKEIQNHTYGRFQTHNQPYICFEALGEIVVPGGNLHTGRTNSDSNLSLLSDSAQHCMAM